MLKLNINIINDSFDGSTAYECARLLRDAADKLENGYTNGSLVDYNGNRVGQFSLEESSP